MKTIADQFRGEYGAFWIGACGVLCLAVAAYWHYRKFYR